ncbi:hypothetical protein J4573_21040 [Actinomadura barringtoniae]|uniref:Chaplin n=1 Tax=Actinomadura barringtoniae TaxID=1427535 RepID=A0A939PBL8_9ACTN|nr:hypothetical protein [Actinomadura barringtoniae]MBO2449600.1 hypothetical protein [Actinomadura barringtoniae]
MMRPANLLATVVGAACLAVHAPAARASAAPADPQPSGGLGILTGLTLNVPVNLPVVACLNLGVTTGNPANNPNEPCVSNPGRSRPKGR